MEKKKYTFAPTKISKKAILDSSLENWKVMIVDDDERVHDVTKLVLRDFVFENRKLEFISAYSGKEAKELIVNHKDIALILLDVVMEEDNSGLEVVRYIREEIENKLVRIVLRTGQPGQAPEERVIIDYDINDYKEKTELTNTKLFTTVLSSLRAWRDLYTIEKNRDGLNKIINSSSNIFNERQSLKEFASGILTQLISILNLDSNSLYAQSDAFSATEKGSDFLIVAGTGKFESLVGKVIDSKLDEIILELLNSALANKKSVFLNGKYVGYFTTQSGIKNLLFIKSNRPLNDMDKSLIDIFSTNVSIAFENFYLNRDIRDTQREIINRLSEVVEQRCEEAGEHVQRVAQLSYKLALKSGLTNYESELLKCASPMHDIGKVGISDSILLKPAKLTPEEFEEMKRHTIIGYHLFKDSKREILKAATIVAHQHHERWDGKGYPQGLSGEDIHIYGRITAIADVFDALSYKRVYKNAWSREEVINFLRENSGTHFDPRLVEIFINEVISEI